MNNITLISTMHKESGKCNSNELYKIIETICPDVIFLEALESSYTEYDNYLLSSFGVYSKRLELNAIQKYSHNHTFEYIPVLDDGLSDEFDKKVKIVCEDNEYQKLIDKGIFCGMEYGFQYLNSEKSVELQEELRELEKHILNNNELCQKADESIDTYENSMIRNIYSYCKENSFNTAIFMCGAAHRKSIMQKIREYEKVSEIKLNWTIYGSK